MRIRELPATLLYAAACFTDPPPAGDDETGSTSGSTSPTDESATDPTTGDAASSGTDGADSTTGDDAPDTTTDADTTTAVDTSGADTTDTGAECIHRAFTTIETFTGAQVDSFANARLLCADEAEDARLDGDWAAVLSDASGPAGDHLVICGDVVLANDGDEVPTDTVIATEDKWWSNDHLRGIDMHADGTPVPSDNTAIAWTGTHANGTSADFDCAGWTSFDPTVLGVVGFTNDIGAGSWIDEDPVACSQAFRLYCIEQFPR